MVVILKRNKLAIIAGLLGAGASILQGQGSLQETENQLREWVETERAISAAKAEWDADKFGMENLIRLYQQELESLKAQVASAEQDRGVAEQRRSELLAKNEEIQAIEVQVSAALAKIEQKLKAMEARLPTPLQQELGPLFGTIPQDGESSSLSIGQRIQPIIAILTQIQKFNQVVTIEEGFREFEAGRTVQTEKVYFGLGAAYYVDRANEHAGYGVMTETGWDWKDDAALIPLVRRFVDIYRGTVQAEYVELPVDIR